MAFRLASGDGPPIRALLEAHLHYAQRRRERRGAIVALAASSVLPWVSLMWPALMPSPVRNLALLVWCALLLVTAAVFGSELRWYRRLLRRSEEVRPTTQRQ